MFLNSFFNKINFLQGFFHWFIQRTSALFIILFIFISLFFFNLYLFLLSFFILTLHVFAGIETLVYDYIHDSIKSILIIFCLRINLLMLLKIVFIIII